MKLKQLREDVIKGTAMIKFNCHQFQQAPGSSEEGGCLIGAALAANGQVIGQQVPGTTLRKWFLDHYGIPTPQSWDGDELRFERDLIHMEHEDDLPRDPRLIVLDKYFPEPSKV